MSGMKVFTVFLQLVYSDALNQLVSGCTECLLRVWDAETGKRLLRMGPNGHGPGVELTAAGLDPSGYRLATGAEDGSVKVWDVGSGQELKERRSPGRGKTGRDEEYSGVIGVEFCVVDDKRCIVVVGHSNRIILLSVIKFIIN